MNQMNRRTLVKKIVLGVGGFLASTQIPGVISKALAAGLKLIDEKSIKRLKYSADVNKEKPTLKKWKEGDKCLNCKFYKRGKTEKDGQWDKEKKHEGVLHAKCTMVANKYVSREGWCKVYSWDKKKFPKKA